MDFRNVDFNEDNLNKAILGAAESGVRDLANEIWCIGLRVRNGRASRFRSQGPSGRGQRHRPDGSA